MEKRVVIIAILVFMAVFGCARTAKDADVQEQVQQEQPVESQEGFPIEAPVAQGMDEDLQLLENSTLDLGTDEFEDW